MIEDDALHKLLVDFFELPLTTAPDDLSQHAIANWDSLAMVQLIGELQATFEVEFDLDEIERLRSYAEISASLQRKRALRQAND
jgi:acyl carrier protein